MRRKYIRSPSSTPTKILRLGQTTCAGYFYCLLSAILDKLICVWGFVSGLGFFSVSGLEMVHVISFVSSAVQKMQTGWDNSIFILVKYLSTTQGTAHVQPECKGVFFADLGILHKQVEQDTR